MCGIKYNSNINLHHAMSKSTLSLRSIESKKYFKLALSGIVSFLFLGPYSETLGKLQSTGNCVKYCW